ncbi:hypothetical protein Tco_0854798, partial [Tanacetum coccineum]
SGKGSIRRIGRCGIRRIGDFLEVGMDTPYLLDGYGVLGKTIYCLSQAMHSPMHSRLNLAFRDLKVQVVLPVDMSCDNSSAMQIAANLVLHERTMHFEIDLFFLRDKITDGTIRTIKVKFEEYIADIFTKGLSDGGHKKFCDKLKLGFVLALAYGWLK